MKERLHRVTLGNLGDFKILDNGVCELRLAFGPGYRIYFGQGGDKVILLSCGGDKASQSKDIKKALQYWETYLESKQ